jgi:hypothetical protein
MCIVEMKTGTIILGSLASPSGSLHEIETQTLFCELVFSSLYLNLYEREKDDHLPRQARDTTREFEKKT